MADESGFVAAIAPPAVVKWIKRGQVWDKCRGRRHYCGCELHPFWTFTIDHLVPKSRGGTNAIENLVASCPDCNVEKGACLMLAKDGRSWLSLGSDPKCAQSGTC